MQPSDPTRSHIVVGENLEELFTEVTESLQPNRVVGFLREDFLIEDAKAAVAEAYISEERTKYIVMGAKSFNTVSQNALLKVLEEPPRNIEFILIVPSKSALLPTIRSRLPMRTKTAPKTYVPVELRLKALDLAALFAFVKENEKLGKHELKELIERVFYQASAVEGMLLNREQTEAFEKAYRLVELNARAQSVLTMLLMTFIQGSRRET